jgi:hypothetical protein
MATRKWNYETTQSIELEITLKVSGSHTPARTYGDPYYCHPEESEEERWVLSASIGDEELPKEVLETLRPYLDEVIYDLDLKSEAAQD